MAVKRKTGIIRTAVRAMEKVDRLRFKNFVTPASPVDLADVAFRGTSLSAPHQHDFYEFLLVRKGTLLYGTPAGKELLGPGSLCFASADTEHRFARGPKGEIALITNLAFSAKLFRETLRFLSVPAAATRFEQGFVWRDVPPLLWERLCQSIDWLRPDSGLAYGAKQGVMKAILMDLAVEVLRRASGEREAQLPEWLARACEKMRETENLRQGLARFISLSGKTQEHLTRSLRRTTGATPTEFINRLRLKNVCDLLATTTQSVTAIAFEAGFNNLAHFNAVFRKELGMPPRDWRKRQARKIVPDREDG